MRFITCAVEDRRFPAALLPDEGIFDLEETLRGIGLSTIAGLLAAGSLALDHVQRIVENAPGPHAMSRAVKFMPPLGVDTLLLATSGNYLSHIEEMGLPAPQRTHCFIKGGSSLIGNGEPILLPPDHGTLVDWEGEFCVVLGRDCHRASAEEAQRAIAGYTLLNDVSARDWVPAMRSDKPSIATAAWRNNILFKQFPSFGPIGPCIVTTDELGDPSELYLTTRLNDEVVQQDRIGAMQFTVPDVIAQLSEVYRIRAGDIVSLGTPAGVGMAHTPQRFLRPGDIVSVEVEGIGRLENPVAAA